MTFGRRPIRLLLVVVASLGCTARGEGACPVGGCTTEGTFIRVNLAPTSRYVIAMTIDGKTATCDVAPGGIWAHEACHRADGSTFDQGIRENEDFYPFVVADDRTVTELRILGSGAKSITMKVTKDGAPLGEKTFEPKYETAPGSIDPDCQPNGCRKANASFP